MCDSPSPRSEGEDALASPGNTPGSPGRGSSSSTRSTDATWAGRPAQLLFGGPGAVTNGAMTKQPSA